MTGDLAELIEAARKIEMNAEQRIEQKVDWVHGNLKASTNHQPKSRDFVAALVWKKAWAEEYAKAMELGRRVAELAAKVAVYEQELGL